MPDKKVLKTFSSLLERILEIELHSNALPLDNHFLSRI